MFQSIKNIFTSTPTPTPVVENSITTTNENNKLKIEKHGNEKDYKNANYFNYYRILENTNSTIRHSVGLTSKNYSTSPVFKLDEFTINNEMNNTSITSLWIQKYTNNSTTPVEGKYTIPLPPYSVVSGFTVEYQDKVFIGKIKGKAKAQEKYSDAIAQGGQAFLAEKSDNGLFTFQIGNLPPNENVTISLTIVSEVGNHLSSLHLCFHRFLFPTTSFKFNFNLNINLTSSIKDIELFLYSNSNTTIKYDDQSNRKKCQVSFSTNNGITDDVVCIVEPENESNEKPQQIIEFDKKNNSYAVSLNFLPSFSNLSIEDINQKSEYIFVVDCSGSMSGEPIKRAVSAMEIIIRSLNENCKFNIYCFGSSFTKAFQNGSKMYNDESIEEISRYVAKISANLGGTELLPVMTEILSRESDVEYPRQVFILTDGEISERDRMIKYAGTHANDTRIFTLGIGSGVDRELVIGLSKQCKGYYSFIESNSEMEEQVMKLVSISMEPMLSNIKIDWDSLPFTQGPSRIRAVYSNETLVVYGLLNSGTDIEEIKNKNSTIKLIGNGPTGQVLEFPIQLDFTQKDINIDSSNSNSIHTIAAFKIIQDLEEQERKGNHKNNQDKIEELGKRFGLVSKYTSYIVTAVSEDNVTEETMKTVNIVETNEPTIQPTYDGAVSSNSFTRSRRTSNSFSQQCAPPPSKSSAVSEMLCDTFDDDLLCRSEKLDCLEDMCEQLQSQSMVFKKKSKPTSSMFSLFKSSSPSVSSAPSPAAPTSSSSISYSSSSNYSKEKSNSNSNDTGLMLLIKGQKANGSWSVSQFPNIDTSKKPSTIDNVDIWITLHLINKITKEYPSQQNQYQLVIQKAIKWVKQQLTRLNISNEYDNLLLLSY